MAKRPETKKQRKYRRDGEMSRERFEEYQRHLATWPEVQKEYDRRQQETQAAEEECKAVKDSSDPAYEVRYNTWRRLVARRENLKVAFELEKTRLETALWNLSLPELRTTQRRWHLTGLDLKDGRGPAKRVRFEFTDNQNRIRVVSNLDAVDRVTGLYLKFSEECEQYHYRPLSEFRAFVARCEAEYAAIDLDARLVDDAEGTKQSSAA